MEKLLIVLFFIILIELFLLSLLKSRILVQINNCEINGMISKSKNLKLNKLDIDVKIYILRYIRIFKIKIAENYFEIFKIKIKFNKLENLKMVRKIETEKEYFIYFLLKKIKKLKIKFNRSDLELEIGTIDIFFTTFLIPVITTIISTYIAKRYVGDSKDYKMKIEPIYQNRNVFRLKIKGEILLKTKHIIDII